MKIDLSKSILSSQDLKMLILEVRDYAKWYRQTAVKKSFKDSNSQQLELSTEATRVINDWDKHNAINLKSLDELVVALEDFEANASRITITLAAPPSNDLKKLLGTWCKTNINQDILVNFKFDSTMLGGIVVNYGSHIYDWSFRKQILAASTKFPEVLRHV